MSRNSRVVGFTLAFMLGGCLWLEANDPAVEQAVKVAESWLELVDRGEFDKSWQEAAAYFQQAVGRERWQQTLVAVRRPLGEVGSRELLEATFKSSLDGAPDGSYVVIRFKTSFSNKVDALETITPMLDPDGQWRVSGYFIK